MNKRREKQQKKNATLNTPANRPGTGVRTMENTAPDTQHFVLRKANHLSVCSVSVLGLGLEFSSGAQCNTIILNNVFDEQALPLCMPIYKYIR